MNILILGNTGLWTLEIIEAHCTVWYNVIPFRFLLSMSEALLLVPCRLVWCSRVLWRRVQLWQSVEYVVFLLQERWLFSSSKEYKKHRIENFATECTMRFMLACGFSYTTIIIALSLIGKLWQWMETFWLSFSPADLMLFTMGTLFFCFFNSTRMQGSAKKGIACGERAFNFWAIRATPSFYIPSFLPSLRDNASFPRRVTNCLEKRATFTAVLVVHRTAGQLSPENSKSLPWADFHDLAALPHSPPPRCHTTPYQKVIIFPFQKTGFNFFFVLLYENFKVHILFVVKFRIYSMRSYSAQNTALAVVDLTDRTTSAEQRTSRHGHRLHYKPVLMRSAWSSYICSEVK